MSDLKEEYKEYKVGKEWDSLQIYTVHAKSIEDAIKYVEDDEDSDDAQVYTVSTSTMTENHKVEPIEWVLSRIKK